MKKIAAICISILFLVVSCTPLNAGDVNAAVQTALAETEAISNIVSTSVAQTQEMQQSALETQSYKTPTPTPTPLPTATPEPVVVNATLNVNANCRSGPHSNFDLVVMVNTGTSVTLIGQNNDNTPWWQVELSDGTQCWVAGNMVTVAGSTETIPEVASPPIPTVFNSAWVGTWTVWQNQCTNNSSGCENIFTITWMMTDPTTLMGSYVTGGCTYIDVLTLSADKMRADGYETSADCGLQFDVHLVLDPNLNQFRGRWTIPGDASTDGYYCGARNGASKPNPTRP
jgi:uncharacterized protein YgiM (DUF1202 family)